MMGVMFLSVVGTQAARLWPCGWVFDVRVSNGVHQNTECHCLTLDWHAASHATDQCDCFIR